MLQLTLFNHFYFITDINYILSLFLLIYSNNLINPASLAKPNIRMCEKPCSPMCHWSM